MRLFRRPRPRPRHNPLRQRGLILLLICVAAVALAWRVVAVVYRAVRRRAPRLLFVRR